MKRPAPRGLAVPRSASTAVRALPPLDVPADTRAAFDAVRAHPVVTTAREEAPSRREREAVGAAAADLVRRSLRAAWWREETARIPF